MSKVTLTVVKSIGLEKGVSKAGKEWKKLSILCQTDGNYPKQVAITFMGKDIDEALKLKAGSTFETTYQPESKEFNGRWYTELKCWGVSISGNSTPPPKDDFAPDNDEDPLPF